MYICIFQYIHNLVLINFQVSLVLHVCLHENWSKRILLPHCLQEILCAGFCVNITNDGQTVTWNVGKILMCISLLKFWPRLSSLGVEASAATCYCSVSRASLTIGFLILLRTSLNNCFNLNSKQPF